MRFLVFALILCTSTCFGQTAKQRLGEVEVANVTDVLPREVPILLWGGEAGFFQANGGSITTPESVYGKLGLNIKLMDGNDPFKQAKDYLSGKSPYFRGTFEQCCVFSEVFNSDPRTKPVMILQLTYSLGDHIVFREQESNFSDGKIVKPTQLQDWRGKKVKVCAQTAGPHIGLIDGSLKAGGLTWSDVEIVWVKDLTGPNGPAQKMRDDPSIDAACVITTDMIGLCSGIDQVGTGAEGTVKGCRVINTTATMNRAIADVVVVRNDFFEKNKKEVQNFVVGYLKGCEKVVEDKKVYGQSDVPEYQKVMDRMQAFFGKDALPTIEEDVHGLILDSNFVRIPGNEAFFNDPNNLSGFSAKQTAGLAIVKQLGFVNQELGFKTAGWDYKEFSKLAGVPYVEPVYASGRIKGEVSDFTKDLDMDTIFSFEIKFNPDQTDFPIESYAADFKRFCESQSTFGNAAIIIEGHADPTLALKHFFWAAKAKNIIQGNEGSYTFNGKPFSMNDTDSIINVIQSTPLSGLKRVDSAGSKVDIPDPRETVSVALALSQTRAKNVKNSIEAFAKKNNYQVDLESVFPRGVGIADPIHARPRNMEQAKENMRVVFRVVKVKAEAISEDDFNFDK